MEIFMKATNIGFTEQHLKKLKQDKKETGLNTSELIRRLLDKYFEEKESKKTK
jgi:hypothetical protein